MKRLSFFPLLALLSLSGGLTARADKLDEWYKLLPKNTVGVIAIKSTPELLADWEKSSSSKLFENEEFKKWTAPMIKEGETPWDKFFKELSGESLHETLKRYPGAQLAIFAADGPDDFSDEKNPVSALSEALGQEKVLEELMAKEAELALKKDESLKPRTLDYEGVTVHILAATEEAEEGWEQGYAFVDGVLVEATSLKMISYLITALKSGAGEGNETVTHHLDRLAQLTEGNTDVLIYLNGEILVQWGLDAARAAAASQGQAIPIAPEEIIDALGIEELQALAMTVDITDDHSRVEMALLHPEKPKGIISLLRGTDGEVNLPAFIPPDVLSGSVTRYSMVDFWDKLLTMVNKLGPIAAVATMQLSGAEAQVGIKLRDDLFASLDDEYIEVTDGSIEKQSQVLAFKVKDRQRLGGALDGVKRFVGAGFAAFEESEYLGYQISEAKAASAQPGSPEIVFCLTDDYFFFSTGPQALLKKVLSRIKEPTGPSIWENNRVQGLLARLPKGYIGAGVADGGKSMKAVVDALTLLQSQTAKSAKKPKSKKGKGPKADNEGAESEENTSWFDPKATPSDEMWKRYFGTSVSGYYTPTDAIHYRAVTTPVEAQ